MFSQHLLNKISGNVFDALKMLSPNIMSFVHQDPPKKKQLQKSFRGATFQISTLNCFVFQLIHPRNFLRVK